MSTLLDTLEDEEVEGLVTPAELWSQLEKDKPELVAWDTESPTYKWWLPHADPFCLTFSWRRRRTYYVPTKREDGSLDPEAAELLYRVFCTVPRLVAHHAKYDLHVAKRLFDPFGIPLVVRRLDDTMILDAILDEQRYHGLKELTTAFDIKFGKEDADQLKAKVHGWIESVKLHEGREPGFDEVPKRLMVPYARQDAYLTLALFSHLDTEMDEQIESGPGAKRDIRDAYALEMSVLWVVFAAEQRGIRADLDFCFSRMADLTPLLGHLRAKLSDGLGWDMNPGSTDDVARALVQLGREDALWTNPKTKKVNLPEWKLNEMATDPLAGSMVHDVLEYRTSAKMLNSYFEVIVKEHHKDPSGQAIVRPNIKQTGARTGRMSVTEPALQTLPREKGNVRGAFIAREQHSLIFADYKAQELRILAHYMAKVGDDSMLRIFSAPDPDPHRATAAALFGVPESEVTKEQRRLAKIINFAIVYGAGQKKIALMMGMELDEAKELLYAYYRQFPGVRKLKRLTEERMRQRGFVVTVFGRRHREREGKFAYKATNSLIQGTSAELTKAAMVRIDDGFLAAGLSGLVLLQVHDEIISESPDEETERAVEVVRTGMVEGYDELCVPLDVDINVAKRWSEAKE